MKALVIALAFGVVHILHIDIQQVSIATLIISLGLLVDMPVVAGDAIKRELGQGSPRDLASWIGPSKLAKAIVFATITNIVAALIGEGAVEESAEREPRTTGQPVRSLRIIPGYAATTGQDDCRCPRIAALGL